ncbi:MAG: SGNH/GDSL hydrolase family protein [Clostridia bacterium]|nr:SGNH/GDSL hydrolase family protein [Clostridia bacterium]
MILNEQQVRSIVKGAYTIDNNAGEYRFHRFSKAQEQYYSEVSPRDFYVKSFATSGIRLDFRTDSDVFGFTYRIENASSRNFYFFDIYVDGIMELHRGEKDMWIKAGRIDMKLPAGEHRVTLWLPCLSAAMLSEITLDDGASVIPCPSSRKMICFGDSISQGYDAEYPSMAYTNRLADHFDADMLNLAIGGEKFVPGLLSQEFADSFRPEIITVAYGTNDWSGFERALFEERTNGFLEKLAEYYKGSKIFIITPIWRGDNHRVTKVGTFDEAIRFIADKAASLGLNVIEGRNLTPHVSGFYSDLRLHPNDFGYGEYTRNLIPEIEKGL